jgi:hypothetical protein
VRGAVDLANFAEVSHPPDATGEIPVGQMRQGLSRDTRHCRHAGEAGK